MRAERNKIFARESRERKRHYVEQLELEVRSLRSQLAYYRDRLGRYELIEKHRRLVGNEMPSALVNAQRIVQDQHLSNSEFGKVLTDLIEGYMQEQKKVFEQLARTIVGISVPLPMRYCLWKAEQHLDTFDPDSVHKIMGPLLPREEMDRMAGLMKERFADKREYYASREAMIDSLHKIRSNIKQLLECQKAIQSETHKVWEYAKNKIFVKYGPEIAGMEMKLFPQLRGKQELTDYAIYRIKDEDFTVDTNCEAEHKEDASMAE